MEASAHTNQSREGEEPLALRFLNALDVGPEGGRSHGPRRLPAPEELTGWLVGAGLVVGDGSLPDRRILLREAWDLASAMARALDAFRRGRPPPENALFTLNRALGAGARTAFVELEGRRAHLRERRPPPESVLALLAPLALDCARLLATADPRRLRTCAAGDCGSWFLDTSKGGRRRWCSMRRCGNRAKAARHRRRRASPNRGAAGGAG